MEQQQPDPAAGDRRPEQRSDAEGGTLHRGPSTSQASADQPFAAGLTARVELTVTDSDTGQALGSGDVPVLATPRVLALAEAATVVATAQRMPAGMTTVGVRVELDHKAATPIGGTVVAQARLAKVDGRRLLFEVTVTEGTVTVAEGRIERVLVDRHKFLERAFGGVESGS
jgi:fluoroacetyl-CoA thioesterase